MMAGVPAERGWWDALFFRLSGQENTVVRQLIAGNPDLPLAAFEALAIDDDTEVLEALSAHPRLPPDVALSLLRRPDAQEFLSANGYERMVDHPGLTSDELCVLMDEVGQQGMRKLLLHPSTNVYVVEAYVQRHGDTSDVALAGQLVERFPMSEHPEVWSWLREDGGWLRALLNTPKTPKEFLLLAAHDQLRSGYMEYVHGSTAYEDTEAICGHPKADEDVFRILLAADKFYEEDQDHDLRCLRLIASHPAASATQRQRAAEFVQRVEAQIEEEDE